MALSPGSQVGVVNGIFVSFAALVCVVRLYTRFVFMRNAGIEDYCLGFATMFLVVLGVLVHEQIHNGLGENLSTLEPGTIRIFFKSFWASIWVHSLALGFIKVSILLQYLRFFSSRQLHITCWLVLSLVIVYNIWACFSSIFICSPIASFWDTTIADGHCMNEYAVWFANGIVDLVTIIATIALTIPIIKTLHLPPAPKWSLIVVLVLGTLIPISSILRLQALTAITNSSNTSHTFPLAAIWTILEPSIFMLCVSLPSLHPLLTYFLPTYFSSLDSITINDHDNHNSNTNPNTSTTSRFHHRLFCPRARPTSFATTRGISRTQELGALKGNITSVSAGSNYPSESDVERMTPSRLFWRHASGDLSLASWDGKEGEEGEDGKQVDSDGCRDIKVVTTVEQVVEERPLPPLPADVKVEKSEENEGERDRGKRQKRARSPFGFGLGRAVLAEGDAEGNERSASVMGSRGASRQSGRMLG